MFQRKRKQKTKLHSNQKGFSLIEVLIAVAILVIVTVPLAMNMISSSQINGKAKQVSTSSDLTTSLMEVMQTVDLSDILTEINGYGNDEYGTALPYMIKDNALANYNIGSTTEMIRTTNEDETEVYYVPVTKSDSQSGDSKATASVVARSTGDVIRAYFRGQKDNNYSFILTSVENDEIDVDIVATITPEKSFSIVNIVSMAQSEVIYAKQTERMDAEVAAEFASSNNKYIALKSGVKNVTSRDSSWFEENMERTITVDLVQDAFSEAVTITMNAVYTVDTSVMENGEEKALMKEADGTITKTLGSFSTNSTTEFARGVYIYFYPLENNGLSSRDHFVINNKNELSVPVFLIGMSDDSNADMSTITNYNPTITINELSNDVYKTSPRTTVCSNIDDSLWKKTVSPIKENPLEIKTIGNASEQQTLYSVVLQVYRHKDSAYNEKGIFTPSDKDLLMETNGTFIDTSEKLDVDSDKTTGLTTTPGIATAGKYSIVYSGSEQEGVYGTNVIWEGTTKATNAGTYTATATPIDGYSWADGSTTTKTITWVIERATTATAEPVYYTYNGKTVCGVTGDFITLSGMYEAIEAGTYTAYATPDSNHAWEDGTYTARSVKWKLSPKTITIKWATGDGYDTWEYDGKVHSGSCTLEGVLAGDVCLPTLENNSIKNVGTKIASVVGLSNKNYALPTYNLTHTLSVITKNSAKYQLVEGGILEYNGILQSVVESSVGVYFAGDTAAKDAGEYTMMACLEDGYTWPDGSVDSKLVKWSITPRVAILKWGENTWTYDGLTHGTTCEVANLSEGDECEVELKGNAIKNVGQTKTEITELSNPNYELGPNSIIDCYLTVVRAKLAYYNTYDYDYDGFQHTGVIGQYITREGNYQATNVRVVDEKVVAYECVVKPIANYAWEDGTYGEKTVTWYIVPIEDAYLIYSDWMYTGEQITGVYAYNTINKGDMTGISPGVYVAKIKPLDNHAWDDTGTVETRTIEWSIVDTTIIDPSLQQDTFIYNGDYYTPEFTIYTVADFFTVSGDLTAMHANINGETYKIRCSLKDKEATHWEDGSTDDIILEWTIHPKEVGISYSEASNTWTYDRTEKSGNATPTGLCFNVETQAIDQCEFTYSNNKRTNQGTQTFLITGTTNSDYQIPNITELEPGLYDANNNLITNWNTLVNTYGLDVECDYQFNHDSDYSTCEYGTLIYVLTNNSNLSSGVKIVIPNSITKIGDRVFYGCENLTSVFISDSVTSIGDYAFYGCQNLSNVVMGSSVSSIGNFAFGYCMNLAAISIPDSVTEIGENAFLDCTDITIYYSGTATTEYPWGGINVTIEDYVDVNSNLYSYQMRINRRTITYKWNTVTWTYDGNSHTVTPTVTNVCSGDTCSISTSNNTRIEYGTQTVTMTGVSNDNYALPSPAPTTTLTINRKASCYYNINALTYNGSSQTGVTWSSDVHYVSGTYAAVNAGNYSVKLAPNVSANGIINWCWSDGSVDAKTVSWSIARQATATYTKQNKTYTGKWQQGVSAGAHSTNLGGTYGATNAGTYNATLYLESSNYAWSDGSTASPRTISWTINKAAGSCTAPTARTLTYTGNPQILINGGSSSTGTMKYKVEGSSTWYTSTDYILGTNAGTYKVYYYSAGDSNHNSTSSSKYITVTISKKACAWAKVITKAPYTGSIVLSDIGTGTVRYGCSRSTSSLYPQNKKNSYATNQGTYYYYLTLNDSTNTTWVNGNSTDILITWKISSSYTMNTYSTVGY